MITQDKRITKNALNQIEEFLEMIQNYKYDISEEFINYKTSLNINPEFKINQVNYFL